MNRSRSEDEPLRFRVGEVVTYTVNGRIRLPARVIEDRGNLGPGGSRILRVVPLPDEDDPQYESAFELFQADLRPGDPAGFAAAG